MKDIDCHSSVSLRKYRVWPYVYAAALFTLQFGFTSTASAEVNRFTSYSNYLIPIRIQPQAVCLYKQPNHVGERFCFTGSQATLPASWNNTASSISMSRAYFATVFADTNFAGSSAIHLADSDELQSLDNVISSVSIELADHDNDGVPYLNDQCRDTPNGEPVSNHGCSASQNDADVDGISDAYDSCAGTVFGETVNVHGCAEGDDADGDGIPNSQDSYPYQNNGMCTP